MHRFCSHGRPIGNLRQRDALARNAKGNISKFGGIHINSCAIANSPMNAVPDRQRGAPAGLAPWIAEFADLHGVLMARHGTGDGLLELAALVRSARRCRTTPSRSNIRAAVRRGSTTSSMVCLIRSCAVD